MGTFNFDHLEETEFEEFCYDLMGELGFINLSWRKGTGLSSSPSDQGRDIECDRVVEDDLDKSTYVDKYFVECKHYKQGVPPDKIAGALAWAMAERPSVLILIASNFFSNPTKEHIKKFIENNKPSFKIKTWERPRLETLCIGKNNLLRKYRISSNITFLNIMHPAHLMYIKENPEITFSELFNVLDTIDINIVEGVFGHSFLMAMWHRHSVGIRNVQTGKNFHLPPMYVDNIYEKFKEHCLNLEKEHLLAPWIITGYVVFSSLSTLFAMSNKLEIDEVIDRVQAGKKKLIDELGDKAHEIADIDTMDKWIKDTPDRITQNYEIYAQVCETVLAPLITNQYFAEDKDNT